MTQIQPRLKQPAAKMNNKKLYFDQILLHLFFSNHSKDGFFNNII